MRSGTHCEVIQVTTLGKENEYFHHDNIVHTSAFSMVQIVVLNSERLLLSPYSSELILVKTNASEKLSLKQNGLEMKPFILESVKHFENGWTKSKINEI